MSAVYKFELYNPAGAPLTILNGFAWAKWGRKVNEIGALQIKLPGGIYNHLIQWDSRIRIKRSLDGGQTSTLDGETDWWIKKWTETLSENGESTLEILALDNNHIPGLRIIPAYAGSAGAEKSGYADNLMKDLIKENLTAATDTARNLSFLTVQANKSAAAQVKQAFAYQRVLNSLQNFCNLSTEAGTWLAFDVVSSNTGGVQFRTYINQRGTYHGKGAGDTARRLVGWTFGNVGTITSIHDYENAATAVIAGGQGQEENRIIKTALNNVQIALSPLGRVEFFVNATNTADPAVVQARADSELQKRRPVHTLEGNLKETPGFIYGLDFDWGDVLAIQGMGYSMDAHLDTVITELDESGARNLTMTLRGEQYV